MLDVKVVKTMHRFLKSIPLYDRSVLELLQQEPVISGVDHPPTDGEILKAVNSLKNNASGESGLTSQMFKAIVSNNQTFQLLRSIILDLWKNELPPDQWETGLLKIIPKKGDLSQPGNYRGIMLLEVAYKIIAKIVHSCQVPIAEKLDRVPRDLLWIILERFGFPPKIVTILKSLHKNANVKFTVGTVTHILSSIIGVKQRDILGPILFTILIAAIIITWRKMYDRLCIFRTKKDFILTGRRSTTKGIDFSLSDSEYADDTAVLFDSKETLETFSPLLINHFEKIGMEVHVGHCDQPNKPPKTEVLFVSAPPSSYA